MQYHGFVAIMGLSPTELVVIGLIVVLLFGARKLPELAHSMGSSIQSFKKGMKDGAEEPKAEAGKDSSKPSKGSSPNGHHG